MTREEPLQDVAPEVRCWHEVLSFTSSDPQQFLDITPEVAGCCQRSAVSNGFLTVQSRHTTAAVLVQEHEPLLLEDLARMLQSIAPRQRHYCHNDIQARTDVPPDERPNGHSHARALLLPSSVQLVVAGGRLDLGRWQRLFLVELDGPRQRQVSVMVLGLPVASAPTLRVVSDTVRKGAGE